MKLSPKKCIRHLIFVLVISLTSIPFWGCANVQHQASFNKNYLPQEDVRIKVAKVINDTGYTFDIDIEKMLANSLEQQLAEENLLNLGKTEPNLFLESRIIGYKKGSAFKRWMMPGWGATELAIRCDLKDGNNNPVGSAMSNREIVAGGLYTVGAWETIFKEAANDVAEDLKDQIEAQGYVVKPKTRPQTQTAGKDIEQKAQGIDQSQEVPKLAAIPKDVPTRSLSLRSQSLYISNQTQVTRMLIEYGFFDNSKNPHGSFESIFVDNMDGTITDKATGLMWQQSGSSTHLNNQRANIYIERSNEEQFAGYSDWRMPTVEELASLLTRSTQGRIHLDPLFDDKQIRCWTVDPCDPSYTYLLGSWIIDFQNGEVSQAHWWKGQQGFGYGRYALNPENHVKAVRSVK